MEAGRRLLASPPPNPTRTHVRNRFPTSVPMLHDQASWTNISVPTTSIVCHFPMSVLSQEQRDDYKTNYISKEEQNVQDDRQVESGRSCFEEKAKCEVAQCLRYFEHQLLYHQVFWYPFLSLYTEEKTPLAMSTEPIKSDHKLVQLENCADFVRPADVLALAKRAMRASRKAASLMEESNILAAEFDESHFLGGSTMDISIKEEVVVRSKRLLERRSKKRKVGKNSKNVACEVSKSMTTGMNKKIDKGLDPNDPLRLFLWGPETKQLLTVKEEKDLFVQIQDLMRLEEVQQRLRLQFDREPTLSEWAQAVGMSCQALQCCLSSGKRSREKMINANLRLVVHVAKQYEGKGLNILDLLQEGSRGLMKSLEKFKPKVGCRFSTYAYWWIRQSIRKAIFLNSRVIRLPENVFGLLNSIKKARRLFIQEGHAPTNEEIAKQVGISVERLKVLLLTTRNPISIQECAWTDQDVTFQEITGDPEVETPDLSMAKQMMRQHVRGLLRILKPRERQIIQYRFGIPNNEPKSLTEIGVMFGLSKERVRQLESRALDKLKDCRPSHGLGAYLELLL
ncbi:RNA polymerase sigma factor sigF, chloroplastic isoform X2 [Phoenix dactylifera]|uniref:RNA polymerase sigma factor sigF, chloroplastic isoform X2 n=1 Tax=Phoenix dactylifera TaxID=42345 RepID=A0A8B9A6Q3_PHODC|nr:RNA polymerase sigma factor sigF, chloroplastic isoform X2 [Phoenix dactylifera]